MEPEQSDEGEPKPSSLESSGLPPPLEVAGALGLV